MPGALPLVIAGSVIAVVVVAILLLTLRLGRMLAQLDEKQQERKRQAIVERARRYG